MKFKINYEDFYNICICMAEKLKEYNPDEIVCVMRGGMSASHIITKYLNKKCGCFFPEKNLLYLTNEYSKKIIFIEDLVAKGRTFNQIYNYMIGHNIYHYHKTDWKFAPFLIDDTCKVDNLNDKLITYGIKTNHWAVMPYEDFDMMKENDRGLFREGNDQYGK